MKRHIVAILTKIFAIGNLIKLHQVKGELPTSKEAYKTSFFMAWPSAIEAVLISLMGSIDTIMVGGLGASAIAAVGITNQPKFILLAVILSLNVGVTAIVARRKGQNDQDGANSCLKQSLLISFVLALVMATIGFIFAEPIMVFAGAEPDVAVLATTYFRILMVSIVFTSISLTINAAQRGAGNTKISMRTNLAANIVNLIFNLFLINGIGFFPAMGVAGAATATLIGTIVGCIMSVMSLIRNTKFLKIDFRKGVKFDRKTITALANISGSAMVEQVFIRIGFFTSAKVVATLGTVAFATHQICMNIIGFSFAFGDGLSVASSALVGQSLGAKRPDMAIIYGKIGQRIAFVISTILCFIFIFGGKFLVGIFTPDQAIIASGAVIMIIIALTTHAQTSQVVVSGCLRGAGDTKYVAVVSFISIGIVRPLLTYLFCIPCGFGIIGAWMALFVDQYIRLILNFTRFSKGKWCKIEI